MKELENEGACMEANRPKVMVTQEGIAVFGGLQRQRTGKDSRVGL